MDKREKKLQFTEKKRDTSGQNLGVEIFYVFCIFNFSGVYIRSNVLMLKREHLEGQGWPLFGPPEGAPKSPPKEETRKEKKEERRRAKLGDSTAVGRWSSAYTKAL